MIITSMGAVSWDDDAFKQLLHDQDFYDVWASKIGEKGDHRSLGHGMISARLKDRFLAHYHRLKKKLADFRCDVRIELRLQENQAKSDRWHRRRVLRSKFKIFERMGKAHRKFEAEQNDGVREPDTESLLDTYHGECREYHWRSLDDVSTIVSDSSGSRLTFEEFLDLSEDDL